MTETEEKKVEKELERPQDQGIHIHKKIDHLIFGILSPQLIKKMASAKVVTPEL